MSYLSIFTRIVVSVVLDDWRGFANLPTANKLWSLSYKPTDTTILVNIDRSYLSIFTRIVVSVVVDDCNGLANLPTANNWKSSSYNPTVEI